MNETGKKAIYIMLSGGVGLACAHFLIFPQAQKCIEISEKISGIFQIFGGIFAISGSFLGWSLTAISQTRTILKDYGDNRTADTIFYELSDLQSSLIQSWAIVFTASIVSVLISAIMLSYWIHLAGFTLMIAFYHTIVLLKNMIRLSNLKIELDNYDFEEKRKELKSPSRHNAPHIARS